MNIIPIYKEFYHANRFARILFFKGGKRSGKTHFICQLIMFLCLVKKVKVYCIAADYPRLIDLMMSFTKATGIPVNGSSKGPVAKIGDSEVFFRSFDSEEKASQGKECDYAYFYECRSIAIGVVRAIMAGCRIQAFGCYNPCEVFWRKDYYTDAPTLVTTYKDNPFLPPVLIQDYIDAEERANRPDATAYDVWWRDVFCDGKENVRERLCFENSELCSESAYDECAADEILCIDFGGEHAVSDPTVLIGIKIIADRIYVREYYYDNETGDLGIAEVLKGIDYKEQVLVYETATEGKRRMYEIMQMAGDTWFQTFPAIKGSGSVVGGINDLQPYRLMITEHSRNVWNERNEYRFVLVNGILQPIDKYNHAFDAIRYGFRYYNVMVKNM